MHLLKLCGLSHSEDENAAIGVLNSDYVVVDRRRVTAAGSRRQPSVPPRPSFSHKPFKQKVAATWRHVSTHLQRGVGGSHQPDLLWTHVWGLALSSKQTHDAITLLVADRLKPDTLPLQGAILVRSMLEVLGNILALTGTASAIKWFLADGYRRRFEQIRAQREIFGEQGAWRTWFDQMDRVLEMQAKWAGLGVRRRRKPGETIPDWPTPYRLSHTYRVKGRTRPLPILIRGNRAKLFEKAYKLWYSELSSYAHQRAAAAQAAIFAANPDAH